jgi:hypothetical protein
LAPLKKAIRSFTTFSRTERAGLLGLCILLVILLIVRATMPLWVHPDFDTEQQKKLTTAWEAYKRSQPPVAENKAQPKKDFQDAFDENTTPLPDTIDLNTADSATLVRLKGIGPVTAGKIIARRNKKGPYTSIDQLSEVGAFTEATIDLLKKHLCIAKPQR